jgi:hypothetical protein
LLIPDGPERPTQATKATKTIILTTAAKQGRPSNEKELAKHQLLLRFFKSKLSMPE